MDNDEQRDAVEEAYTHSLIRLQEESLEDAVSDAMEATALEDSGWLSQEDQIQAQDDALEQARLDDKAREHASRVAKARTILDFYEANPQLEMPYALTHINQYVWSKYAMTEWAKALPGKKDKSQTDTTYILTGYLPNSGRGPNGTVFANIDGEPVMVKIQASRETVCEKIVTGKEYKETLVYPEPVKTMQEVEIVEWRCTDALLAPESADNTESETE